MGFKIITQPHNNIASSGVYSINLENGLLCHHTTLDSFSAYSSHLGLFLYSSGEKTMKPIFLPTNPHEMSRQTLALKTYGLLCAINFFPHLLLEVLHYTIDPDLANQKSEIEMHALLGHYLAVVSNTNEAIKTSEQTKFISVFDDICAMSIDNVQVGINRDETFIAANYQYNGNTEDLWHFMIDTLPEKISNTGKEIIARSCTYSGSHSDYNGKHNHDVIKGLITCFVADVVREFGVVLDERAPTIYGLFGVQKKQESPLAVNTAFMLI